MRVLFSILTFIYVTLAIGQNTQNIQNGIYKDRITDDAGNPISGIKVEVQGKGGSTYTNYNGEFSIKANYGDVILLSKDGKFINSYRLDGRNDYFINDQRTETTDKKTTSGNYLDSANYYKEKDAFKSIDFLEKHLKSKKKFTNKELSESYNLLADNYFSLKQYDLAISNYLKSLEITDDIDIQLKLAKAYASFKKLNESNNLYNTILSKKVNYSQQINAYEGLGDNYNTQNLSNASLKAYQSALDIAKKYKLSSKISDLNTKIAEVLAKQGNKSESNTYLQNTLRSSEAEPLQKKVSVQNQVADVYQTNRDYDNEIEIRKMTLAELEKAKVKKLDVPSTGYAQAENISISQLNLDIGRAYIDKKEFDKAIPYLEKSASSAKEIKDLEVEKDAIQKLSELYKNIGNSKKALEKYQEYAKLVDILYQQKEAEIQAAMAMSNEIRDKQNRINSLEKDRALSESQFKLFESEKELTVANYRRQKMWIYGLSIGMLLLGFAIFGMYRSNQQRKLANNLLALKSLRTQMNPHFIFNALNSVNNFIAQNDERAANRYLTDFSTLMRSVLHNSELDFIPLEKEIELIQLYTQLEHSRFTDKFEYHINIDPQLDEEKFNIPPMLIQPYVENAVWHGLRYKESKGHLTIDFQQIGNDMVQITITDDGIGRQKSKELKTQNQKKQESKGMSNIKKRIEILNEMYADKVSVEVSNLRQDGTGTKVVIRLKA